MNQDEEMNEDGEEETNRVYGGCEGPDSMYVKLISSDGHEFIVKRELALHSVTIKALLDGPSPGQNFAENEVSEIEFPQISSPVMERVCSYLAYRVQYEEYESTTLDFPIALEISVEVLVAADFLVI